MDNNISFSKIVATPTLNSWSQAYNAGKLFAVLSLEKKKDLNQDSESLNPLGRDLLEKLEQEFFTIEKKNLESIKTAIFNTFQKKRENVNISFVACAFVNNILYLFILGKGKVFLKRGDKFGLVLSSANDSHDIISSSGFLKEADLIVLATDAFSEVIANDDLNLNLTNGLPSEIAESFAPKIHKAENGKISAIIIKYGKPLADPPDTQDELARPLREGKIKQEEETMEKQVSPFYKYLSILKSKSAGWRKKPNLKIAPTKKIFLITAIIIIFVLIFSIFLAIKQQNSAKVKTLFAQIYPEAQKKYDEGESLLDLNKNLARDLFLAAEKMLDSNKAKFPVKSEEATQIQDLLKKVEIGLRKASPVDKSGLDRSKLSITVENGSGIEGAGAKAANLFKKLGYSVASTGNADNYNYQGMTIKVKKEKSAFLNLLKKDLAKDYTITSSSSDLPPSSSTDALIIIGK